MPSRGRPGGLLTPRCRCRDVSRVVAAICPAVCTCVGAWVHAVDRARNALNSRRWFSPASAITDQRRAVLDVVKALAALDPADFGLDDACAQLEGSTYVMAKELEAVLHIDPSSRQTYREVLDGAFAHSLRSRN